LASVSLICFSISDSHSFIRGFWIVDTAASNVTSSPSGEAMPEKMATF
jgi:hypothetical protein